MYQSVCNTTLAVCGRQGEHEGATGVFIGDGPDAAAMAGDDALGFSPIKQFDHVLPHGVDFNTPAGNLVCSSCLISGF